MQNIHLEADCLRPGLTELALCSWVGKAQPGDRLAYHHGYLAIDAAPDSLWGTPAERQQLGATAGRAWQLAQQGLLHLVQRRRAAGEYTYYVVARYRPRGDAGARQTVLQEAGLASGVAAHAGCSRRSA